jgi:hypothetical protein
VLVAGDAGSRRAMKRIVSKVRGLVTIAECSSIAAARESVHTLRPDFVIGRYPVGDDDPDLSQLSAEIRADPDAADVVFIIFDHFRIAHLLDTRQIVFMPGPLDVGSLQAIASTH